MAKNLIYGNWKILAPDGDLLNLVLEKDAKWYLDRDLAEIVDKETIKLFFEPKGRRCITDLYTITPKENKCVVCGNDDLENLTKHHIVPSEYRKLLPISIKGRDCHDVVAICRDCHDNYELTFAIVLRNIISEEYNAPFNNELSLPIVFSLRYGNVLVNHHEALPKDRYEEILKKFCDATNMVNPTIEDIEIYVEKNRNISIPTHAELVMNQILDDENKIFEFIKRWRLDFINNMDPKYMPKYWDINRPLKLGYRDE